MSARHRIPEPSEAGRRAAAALRRLAAGRVLDTPLARWLYATDASAYRVVPELVLVAGSTDDLIAAAHVAAEHGLPLTPRGAATSLAGQAIGPGIVVDCFKLCRVLAIDADRRTARVEPGVVQAQLNRAAAVHGLEFGPDTSTVDQATIGGMVGNNSSGSRSILYGETRDRTLRVAAVLAGGDDLVVARSPTADPGDGLRGAAAPRVARALREIAARVVAAGVERYPKTVRCTTGYDLRTLLGPTPDPARLLAGSEGTLALFTEVEVALDPRPALRLGAAFTFATLRQAFEANGALLSTGPSAVELLDLGPLRASPSLAAYRRMASLLDGDEEAMLTVEYQGEADEVADGLARSGRARARPWGAPKDDARRAGGHGGGGRHAPGGAAAAHGGARRRTPGVVRGGHRGGAGAARRLRRRVPPTRRRARRAGVVHRAHLGRLSPCAAPARSQDGGRRRDDGRARRRGRTAGRRLPRRALRRARVRALALLLPAAAVWA